MNEYDPKLFVHPRWQKFYDQGLRTCEGKSAPHFAEANTLLLTTHTQLGHRSSLSILEFGSNTGSLCYEIMHKHKDHIKSYTLVDEDKLLSQAIPKLRRHKTKLKFCNIPDTNDCLGQPYNLLIAFGSCTIGFFLMWKRSFWSLARMTTRHVGVRISMTNYFIRFLTTILSR